MKTLRFREVGIHWKRNLIEWFRNHVIFLEIPISYRLIDKYMP
jgi:hypothetical protein